MGRCVLGGHGAGSEHRWGGSSSCPLRCRGGRSLEPRPLQPARYAERLINIPDLPRDRACPVSRASPRQPRRSPGKRLSLPAAPSPEILSEEHFNFVPISQIITEAAACAPLDPGCCRLLGEVVINEKDQLP